MKVLALCDSFSKAHRIWSRVARKEGIALDLLIGNSERRSLPLWFAAALWRFVKAGPIAWVWMPFLLLRGRLKITSRTFDDTSLLSWLTAQNYHAGLHAAGGALYRKPLLDCFRLGVLNPHIGILPHYRGRSVMEWSVLEGSPTGISVFVIDEGVDTGAVILSREFDAAGYSSVQPAKDYLFSRDAEMFAEALEALQKKNFSLRKQALEEGRRHYRMSGLLSGVVERILRDSQK